MESVSLLQTAVRSRKDVVRVVHQARQLAKFLRFSLVDQLEIAAKSLSMAYEIASARSGAAITFQLSQRCLLFGTIPAEGKKDAEATSQFRIGLPEATEMSRDDFIWVIAQLQLLLKVDALDIIRQQNDELREISQAFRNCQKELQELRNAAKSPAA